jgi:hypothetical protein
MVGWVVSECGESVSVAMESCSLFNGINSGVVLMELLSGKLLYMGLIWCGNMLHCLRLIMMRR